MLQALPRAESRDTDARARAFRRAVYRRKVHLPSRAHEPSESETSAFSPRILKIRKVSTELLSADAGRLSADGHPAASDTPPTPRRLLACTRFCDARSFHAAAPATPRRRRRPRLRRPLLASSLPAAPSPTTTATVSANRPLLHPPRDRQRSRQRGRLPHRPLRGGLPAHRRLAAVPPVRSGPAARRALPAPRPAPGLTAAAATVQRPATARPEGLTGRIRADTPWRRV